MRRRPRIPRIGWYSETETVHTDRTLPGPSYRRCYFGMRKRGASTSAFYFPGHRVLVDDRGQGPGMEGAENVEIGLQYMLAMRNYRC